MTQFGAEIKKDFPTFKNEQQAGRPYYFFDSAASSLTPEPVLAAMNAYYRTCRSNVHRGLYTASLQATDLYEAARQDVARLINVAPEEVVFTRGTTESLNLLAYSLSPSLKPDDEVVISILEHHANLVPWQQMAKRYGFKLRFLPLVADYNLDMAAVRSMINSKTKIVSVAHISNVLGTVNPIRELSDLAHQAGALLIVDAAQSVGHRPVDFQELGCDFLAFSGHKMYGPTGVGVLAGRAAALAALPPFIFGGSMIVEVTKEDSEWNEVPHKFEAGTPSIAEAIGLGSAVKYIEAIGLEKIAAHEHEVTMYAIQKLSEVEGLKIIGPAADVDRGGVISFVVEGIHPHDLAHLLGEQGVCVRGGYHCAMPLFTELGLPGSTRASIGVYCTKEDVDVLVEAVKNVKQKLQVI